MSRSFAYGILAGLLLGYLWLQSTRPPPLDSETARAEWRQSLRKSA